MFLATGSGAAFVWALRLCGRLRLCGKRCWCRWLGVRGRLCGRCVCVGDAGMTSIRAGGCQRTRVHTARVCHR
eukprot:354873-Chlamydomonas_euryale.AAC.13